MSIGGEIKHAVHHAAHKVEHAAKEGADKVKDGVEEGADKAEDGVEDAADQVTDWVGQIDAAGEKQLKAIANRAGDETIKLAKVGEDLSHKLQGEIRQVEAKIKQELTDETVKEALALIGDAIHWARTELHVVETRHPALADHLNGKTAQFNLGPLVLYYAGFFTRVEDLATVVDDVQRSKLHVTRKFVMGLVKDLGPTTIDVDADIEFLQRLGFDLRGLDLATFLQIADGILDAIGVPE